MLIDRKTWHEWTDEQKQPWLDLLAANSLALTDVRQIEVAHDRATIYCYHRLDGQTHPPQTPECAKPHEGGRNDACSYTLEVALSDAA